MISLLPKSTTMNLAGVVPGWLIGFLVREDDGTCEYRMLPVISLIGDATTGDVEPVVMLPDGRAARAADVGERAFAAGPHEDVRKIAAAHAATRGCVPRSAAA